MRWLILTKKIYVYIDFFIMWPIKVTYKTTCYAGENDKELRPPGDIKTSSWYNRVDSPIKTKIQEEVFMLNSKIKTKDIDESQLSHTRYNCLYHIVFIPRYRRKAIYGKLRRDIGVIFYYFYTWNLAIISKWYMAS
jgi:hypothetical protein